MWSKSGDDRLTPGPSPATQTTRLGRGEKGDDNSDGRLTHLR